jgi:2-dehydro-3-deoxyphosphooctonate aldolase (KDO 8-P synthase)
MTRQIKIRNIKIGANSHIVLIAGPCVIENKKSCFDTAKRIKDICARLDFPFVFKASFDKANRTSLNSFRGPGLSRGIKILEDIKKKLNLPILSDVHCRDQVKEVKDILDIIQIPAFLCRQTDLLLEVARTGKIVNVKKGQFLSPWDMRHVVDKIESTKNKNLLITERGVSFGYNNLVSDFRSLVIMRKFGYPIIYDATHSVQLPGGGKGESGGNSEFVQYLARAAVAVGCDGLFMEVHPNPKKALSDASSMIGLKQLESILIQLKKIDRVIKCQ